MCGNIYSCSGCSLSQVFKMESPCSMGYLFIVPASIKHQPVFDLKILSEGPSGKERGTTKKKPHCSGEM